MKTRLLLALLAIGVVAVLLLGRRQAEPPKPPASLTTTEPATPELPEAPVTAETAPAVPGTAALSATPAVPADVQTEIEGVKFFIRDYRAAFGETPVGNNAEITKALMGANPTKTKFVLPGDSRLNANGELIDHWGTPYFFHAISSKQMEIRSAGPDRQMWSADDIVMP